MSIDQIIEQKIEEQVAIALSTHLDEIITRIVQTVSKPEYESWGRYLSPKQAMTYTGFKSANGFKEMCRVKSIRPIKTNNRVLRYDRRELDKINSLEVLQEYRQTL